MTDSHIVCSLTEDVQGVGDHAGVAHLVAGHTPVLPRMSPEDWAELQLGTVGEHIPCVHIQPHHLARCWVGLSLTTQTEAAHPGLKNLTSHAGNTHMGNI